jgi:Holliday junction resolvasome RuvABC endonuclease subunit
MALVEFGGDFSRWITWTSGSEARDYDSSIASRRRRVRRVLAGIIEILPPRIDLSVIEAPSYGSKGGSVHEREWLRGMLIDQLCARGPVVEIAPSRRALLATGNGRADKKEVLEDVSVSCHDVADAVALATAGAHRLGHLAQYDAKQISAHEKVSWPVAPMGQGEGKRS